MQAWTVIDSDTGAVVYPCLLTEGEHPIDAGWRFAEGQEFIPLDQEPVMGREVWNGSAWVADGAVLAAELMDRVDVALAAAFARGFTVPFGTLAGKALQVRDLDDRTNWLTSQAAYSAQIAAGNGAVEEADFRTADNETKVLSFAEGLNVLLAMAAWGASLMRISWGKKDAILAGDLTVDPEAGWP